MSGRQRRVFLFLWGLGILGSVAILPSKMTRWPPYLINRYPLGLGGLLATDVLINGVMLTGLLTYIGLRAGRNLGLGPPLIERWIAGESVGKQVRGLLPLALIAGVLSVIAITPLEVWVFAPRIPQLAATPELATWKGVLAAFYGGITEELMVRLGLFSIVAWILTRLGVQRTGACWAANVTAAVLFGVMHLPATASLLPLTPLVVTRALLLNGAFALVLGHLYWTRGLEAAIMAHFTADIAMVLF